MLDAKTGKQLWQHAYNRPHNISYPAGPRCTPTVDGDRVYILGSEGDLRALRVSNGDLVWKRHLNEDSNAEVPIEGFASHSLLDGNLLYTMVGGEGQMIVAFDKLTGEVKWKAVDDNAGYCPLSIVDHGGARQLIVYHPTAVTSLNPTTGRDYWSVPIARLLAFTFRIVVAIIHACRSCVPTHTFVALASQRTMAMPPAN